MVKGRDVAVAAAVVGLGLYAWQKAKAVPIPPPPVAPTPAKPAPVVSPDVTNQCTFWYNDLLNRGWDAAAKEFMTRSTGVTDSTQLYAVYMDVYNKMVIAPPEPAPAPAPPTPIPEPSLIPTIPAITPLPSVISPEPNFKVVFTGLPNLSYIDCNYYYGTITAHDRPLTIYPPFVGIWNSPFNPWGWVSLAFIRSVRVNGDRMEIARFSQAYIQPVKGSVFEYDWSTDTLRILR